MSWLSETWNRNRGAIGNAVKNVSPLLAFTPLGPLGAGAAGALGRAIQPGANAGSILKSGLGNAAIGGGAAGLARGAGLVGNPMAQGGLPTSEAFSGPQGLASRVNGALGSAGNAAMGAAKKDPLGAIQAVGSVTGGVMDGRNQNAQLDFQKKQYEDEQERRRRIAQSLAPLFQQLQQGQQQPFSTPYGPQRPY